MKILQINAVYKCLSTGTNVYEINTLLNQVGHQCVAAFSTGKITDPRSEYKIGRPGGQKLHALLSRVTGLQGYFSRHATKKLLRYMDEFQPDVVVLNNLHANYIHLPKLLTYLAEKDIPTVAVLHDCWFYTGKCCYYTTANCNKWQTGCENCPAWKNHNKSWFFDRTKKMHRDRIRLFNAIPRLGVVAVSDWLLEQAKQSPVFANARYVQRIHNWINLNAFVPVDGASLRQKLGLEHKKVILSMAAKWETRKGLDTVLWMNEHRNEDEQIVVVGKLLPGTKLPKSIIHVPFVSGSEALAAYYSMADVFLQPSLEETFGKVTAEALACGTPVVCFDSTANPELVGEHCGAVLPVGDNQGMLEQMRIILRIGKNSESCRQYACAHFDMLQNIAQYAQLFEQLQHPRGAQEKKSKVRVLWVINMVMPEAAAALGLTTSFSGGWLIDYMHCLAADPDTELATMTYANVEKPIAETVNGVKHYIFPGGGKRLLFTSKKTDQDCKYVLEDFQPDVIHLHGTEYSIAYSMVRLQPKQPILLTIQGILTRISKQYKGGLNKWTFWKNATFKQWMRLKAPIFSQVLFNKNAKRERRVLHSVKWVTGRTTWDKAVMQSINPKLQYYRLNYNLRPEFYTEKSWKYDTMQPHSVYTGAAGYSLKGLHILIQAMAIVKSRYPDTKLYIPGNSTTYKASNGYERYIRRLIDELGLTDNVVFAGRKSAQQVVDTLTQVNVCVVPSAMEGASATICEAMMIGTPAICAFRGGMTDLLKDGISGFVYDFPEYPVLAERICQLFEDRALCEQFSALAKADAQKRHDRDVNYKKLKSIYLEILNDAEGKI